MSRQIVIPVVLFLFSISVLHISCTHETLNLDQQDTICFDSQILPLLQNSCGTTGCHDAANGEVDFLATNYQSVINYVKPGDPKGSKLYTVITDIWSDKFMPPENPLPKKDRNLILIWIAQGAMETTCEPDTNNNNQNPDTVCFVQDILPIFLSSCAVSGCHDAITQREDYNLSDYSSIMSNPEGIVPYNPENSKIFEVVSENESDDRMPPPPRSALTSNQIEKLRKWILGGALNSDCPEHSCDTLSTISYSDQVSPIIENNCLSCHNSTSASGGVLLNNYENVRTTAETEYNGTSLLVGTIRNLDGFPAMPPNSQLNLCSIRIIELWIEQGLQNN